MAQNVTRRIDNGVRAEKRRNVYNGRHHHQLVWVAKPLARTNAPHQGCLCQCWGLVWCGHHDFVDARFACRFCVDGPDALSHALLERVGILNHASIDECKFAVRSCWVDCRPVMQRFTIVIHRGCLLGGGRHRHVDGPSCIRAWCSHSLRVVEHKMLRPDSHETRMDNSPSSHSSESPSSSFPMSQDDTGRAR